MELVFLAASVAWWNTALVYKDGPYNYFARFRDWVKATFPNNPLHCSFCVGPYVLVGHLPFYFLTPSLVHFFGILGIAAALRGLQQEFS